MRNFILILFLLNPTLSLSNNFLKFKTDSVWTSPDSYYLSRGKVTTLVNQSQYKNWVAGGINNLSLTLILDYDYILKKGDLEWINRIDGAYGIVKNQNESLKKNEDRFELYSLLALKNLSLIHI